MRTCPPKSDLEYLLTDALSDRERGALEEHVGRCPGCLALLDRLTSDPTVDRWRALHATNFLSAADPDGPFLNRVAGLGASLTGPGRSVAHGCGPSDSPTPPAVDPLPDVPGYQVLGRLGRGGMGVVYKARQVALDRVVALKMVRGYDADADSLARFRAEAEAVARLQHPNIVQIFDVGTCEGRPYFALEYVPGGSLADHIAGTPQSPRLSAGLVETLARTIHYAHDHSVVHRDLKPANVLLAEGRSQNADCDAQSAICNLQSAIPKITDFGLAKRIDADSGLTQTGIITGTPSYMAPEQAAGDPRAVGPAADVYALGGILYELLTGRPPFRAATPLETLVQARHADPVPPGRFQVRLPADLEIICLKCLAKEPHRRYATAAALADDLGRFLAGRPVTARPASAADRVWKWAKRRPASAALMVVSIVAVLALGAVASGLVYDARLSRAYERAETYRYFHLIALAQAEWRDNNLAQTERHLDDCPEVRRHWEWHYLKRLTQSQLLTLDGHAGEVRAVAFSPDGALLATAGDDDTIRIWSAATGQPVHLFRGPDGAVDCVAFSPDGTQVAAGGADGVVRLWDPVSGRPLVALDGRHGAVHGVAFSTDGRHLAAGGKGELVQLWDVAARRPLQTLRVGDTVRPGDSTGVAFGPDGSQVAASGTNSYVRLWDLTAGGQARTLLGHNFAVNSVAFTPDGTRLVSAGVDGTICAWDARSSRESMIFRGHTDAVNGVAFNSDGSRLVSAGADRTVRIWDTRTGRLIVTLAGHRDAVLGVAYDSDGARLASASRDKTAKIWDATTAPDARVIRADSETTSCVAFSPDGRHLATGGGDKAVKVWDVTTGQVIAVTPAQGDLIWSLAYDSRGDRLAAISRDGALRLYDATTARPLWAVRAYAAPGRGVAFSPDGTRLASVGWHGTVKVWDMNSESPLMSLAGDPARGECVTYSPDGRWLASAGQTGEIRVWHAADGTVSRTLLGHVGQVRSLAFSRDGRRLASVGADQIVHVWDMATGDPCICPHDQTNVMFGAAFSPDARRLATACSDGTVKIWDTESGEKLLNLTGHTGEVFGVAFSPDGWRLATVGRDGTLRIWDARPLSSAVADDRAAVNLLDGLFAKPLRRDDVVAHLRELPGVSTAVRERAVALAALYRECTDAEAYRRAAWAVVRQSHAHLRQYQLAVRQSEAACRLAPDRGQHLTALGAALFRVGRVAEALASLARAAEKNPTAPTTLAFLAMAHQKLGRAEPARDVLARLRTIMRLPALIRGGDDAEQRQLLEQAEAMIGEAARPEH